jgi:hypothetical protein
MSWTQHAELTLKMLLENMVAEGRLARDFGLDASPEQIVAASSDALQDVIFRSLPLASVMDRSDLVIHAEGPSVREASPSLAAFNWIAGTAERSIRKLSSNIFDLLERDARRLSNALDLRMTGMAPGSLYLGFSIAAPRDDLISSGDEPVYLQIRDAIHQLPILVAAIDQEEVSGLAAEILPDAAERDAALTALHQLSPTGRKGVHTLDLTAPGTKRGRLSQRERVVLADALRRPKLANRHRGSFSGEVREIDLDARRMHLRNVPGIGSLRCVLPDLDSEVAKHLLGEFAAVEGVYEVDPSGRPRLLLVENVRPLARAPQILLPT